MTLNSVNASFDPYTQNITLLLADGVTPYTISLATVDYNRIIDFGQAISYGAQTGACLVMLLCLVLLTTDAKRWGLLFNLNIACLLTAALDRLFLSLYYTSSYEHFYNFFSPESPIVPASDEAVSILSAILPIFLTILVNFSLLLQAYTVLQTVNDNMKRHIFIFFSCLVFLNAIGWRLAEGILNVKAIVQDEFFAYTLPLSGALGAETIAIWYFSIVFISKLVVNLMARRALNQPPWSKMEVITVMALGTMIIPSIFAIVEWINPPTFPEAGSLTNILVVILLPLSSLWASVTPNSPTCSMRSPRSDGSHGSHSFSRSQGDKCGSVSTGLSSKFSFLARRKGSAAPSNDFLTSPPDTYTTIVRGPSPAPQRDSTEIDLERLGVRVERSYGIDTVEG